MVLSPVQRSWSSTGYIRKYQVQPTQTSQMFPTCRKGRNHFRGITNNHHRYKSHSNGMIKRTVKSSLNFCTVSQKRHNKQNDGADNKPDISSTNSFCVTPVHNHILQFFCGSFENTQSKDKREEGKTYGKCHGLRKSKRYNIFICQHVRNKIN